MVPIKVKTFGFFFLLLCLFVVSNSYAGVYKCKSASGQTTFQDRPCLRRPGQTTSDSNPVKSGVNSTGKHFLWKATLGETTIHLLGSVHVGSSDMYPLAPVITAAYEASRTLVVEVNADEKRLAAAAKKMLQLASYNDGTTLQDHISEKTWDKLSRTAARKNLNLEALKTQKPWAITLALAGLMIRDSGFSPKLGIDRYFITGARNKKPILELESVDEQMALLSQFSNLEQDKLLWQTLKDLDQGPQHFRDMLAAWQTGETQKLYELTTQDINADPAHKAIYDSLFTRRNHSMTEKIDQLVRTGDRYFIVVGSGHMVGPEGIIQLLKNKGYEVTQL